jgi:hypothetical protein
LRKKYTGDPAWHDTRQVAELKRLYRDEILEIFELHRSRVSICQCCECGIEFLTGRSNAGRADLRCPFGCRTRHRSQKSNQRSANYYQSNMGREKKKALNQKRSEKKSPRPRKPDQHQSLQYYRWLIWTVDRRRLGLHELSDLLTPIFEKARQHSLEKLEPICDTPD